MRDIPVVSIVIPTYGAKGVELTRQCLEALWRSGLSNPNATIEEDQQIVPEVIVVDDGSSDADYKQLERVCEANGVHELIHSDVNTAHFAYLVNRGIESSSGHAVILMNNDVEVLPGCVQAMVGALFTYGLHVVAPKLLYPDMRIQFAGSVYVYNPEEPTERGWFDHFLRFQPRYHYAACIPRTCLLTGACMGIHRGALDTIGLLDERFELSAEDVDYGVRAFQASLGVQYLGYAEAIHKEGMTRGKTVEEKGEHSEWTSREARSLQFLWEKHPLMDWRRFGPHIS